MQRAGTDQTLGLFKLLGSGLVAAIATQWIVARRERNKESAALKRDARYLSLRLAALFERFAIDCAELIYEFELHVESKGAAGDIKDRLPDLGEFPSDTDWKAIDGRLAHRVMTMRIERLLAGRRVDDTEIWASADGYDVAKERSDQAGWIGYRAWMLASSLRDKAELPRLNLQDIGHDFVGKLKTRHDLVRDQLRGQAA